MDNTWKSIEAFKYYESKLSEDVKPVSKEAKEFFIKGYNEGLSDNDFTVIGLLEEDFTSEGFKREQFSKETLDKMLNALINLYLSTKRTLKRDLAKELIRSEANNLHLKPKHKRI